jgi:hypothetical protein
VTQVTSTSDSTSAQPPRGPREWIGMLALKYQIERITGDTGVGYSGVPGFGCEPFDSCGLAGDLTLHADLGAGVLTVGSYRRLPAHGHEHMASALRALHSGQAPASADATFRPPAGANSFPDNQGVALPVTETAGFADSPPCRETSHLVAAGLTSRRSGAGLRISLSVAGNQFPDPLRTRCPGPATADIGDLAAGILPLATLGNPTPPLVLRPPPAVTAPGYRGGGHGGLTVALRLVSRNVATRVIRKERFLP